jgi:hypothetical protein
MPRVLEIAIQNAISRRGAAVITGDVAMRDVIMTRVIAADPKETKILANILMVSHSLSHLYSLLDNLDEATTLRAALRRRPCLIVEVTSGASRLAV